AKNVSTVQPSNLNKGILFARKGERRDGADVVWMKSRHHRIALANFHYWLKRHNIRDVDRPDLPALGDVRLGQDLLAPILSVGFIFGLEILNDSSLLECCQLKPGRVP